MKGDPNELDEERYAHAGTSRSGGYSRNRTHAWRTGRQRNGHPYGGREGTDATEYVLTCLAGREDKELRLIRRNAARLLARRRNIILPILHGCVLAPIMVGASARRHGRLGYINIARRPLIGSGADGTDVALHSGIVIHSLWQPATVKKLVHEGCAVHYKLLLDVRRQLEVAAAFG